MRHLDLFTGIGGFAYAAQTVWKDDYELVACCEIDKFCQRVIRKNFGNNVEIINDIKEAKKRDFGRIDLLTGGFPCQPFSVAGRRTGKDDNRYLWPEMLEVIRTVKPRWIIAENVRGLLTIDNGLVFEQVCLDLENAGYEVQPFIIPACAVNAPHRRDRVWIIACDSDSERQQQQKRGEQKKRQRISDNACNSVSGGLHRLARRRSGQEFEDGHSQPEQSDVANTDIRQGRPRNESESGTATQQESGADSPDVADTDIGRIQRYKREGVKKGATARSSMQRPDRHTNNINAQGLRKEPNGSESPGLHGGENQNWNENWLEAATRLCGVFNGLSEWMDRNNKGVNNYAELCKKITRQDMPHLWQGFQSETFQWKIGRFNTIQKPANVFAVLWQFFTQSNRADISSFESKEVQEAYLRNVWHGQKVGCPPQRFEYQEQYAKQHSDTLPQLSYEIALATSEITEKYEKHRTERLKALGNAIVPQVAMVIMEAIKEIGARKGQIPLFK
jgi:DNA-cytosine methyltransferase